MSIRRILLDPQGGAEGVVPPSAPDPAEGFRKLLEKHKDDGLRLAETLYGENFKLRERLRKAEDRVPGDTDVVLKGDDAKRWQVYRDLGEPGDIKKSLKAAESDAEDLGKLRRAESYRAAATVAGYKAEAFAPLAEAERLAVLVKDVEGKDKKVVRAAFVKGEGDQLTPLRDYVDSRWTAFLPALGGPEAEPFPKPNGTPPRRSLTAPPPPPGDAVDPIEAETRRYGHYQSF
jgi:hypothetical protein